MAAPAPTPEADARIRAFFAQGATATALDLSSCGLRALPSSLQTHLRRDPLSASRLTLLNLAHNALSTLPPFLAHFPNLKTLFLLANAFTALPPILAELPAVTMLSFKCNALAGTLPASLLPRRIEWLILTSNALTGLSADFPTRCARVRKLMLSNNALTSLPPTFAAHMSALELLRLANNRLATFPLSLYDLPRLTWLSLGGNPCTGGAVRAPTDLPAALAIADLEAAFRVDWARPFGAGTSGAAYPGVHRGSGQRVAVKRFAAPAGSDGRALDELAVSLAATGVPGVVQAVGYYAGTGADAGVDTLALVSERVGGRAQCIAGPPSFDSCTRSVYEQGKRLSREQAQRIGKVVQEAVEGLLERGIAHGDVYGHNVLVGDGGEVVLADLGAAWWVPRKAAEGARMLEMRAIKVFKEEIDALVDER